MTFVICLLFMKDLSPQIRDQLMVSTRDRALVEARAQGISEEEVVTATAHPWRQIAKWDLVGSSFGIAVFLLIYYAAAAFFTIYYAVNFKNADGLNYTTSQVNGLNTWFWAADILALIVVGILSDRLRVRKPFMVVGTIGAIVTLIVFLGYATNPHTGYYTLALTSSVLAVFLSLAYAPWMAGLHRDGRGQEPRPRGHRSRPVGMDPATGGGHLVHLPAAGRHQRQPGRGQPTPTPAPRPPAWHPSTCRSSPTEHAASVAFATAHQALLTKIEPYNAQLTEAAAAPDAGPGGPRHPGVGPGDAGPGAALPNAADDPRPALHEAAELPGRTRGAAHRPAKGQAQSPKQWQRWFWVDVAGMVVFFPTIWLTRGRWSPRRARRDEEEHERAVAAELEQLAAGGLGSPA